MKKLITVLCLSALPFTLTAQEPATVTTVATQTAGNAAVEGIKSVADYVARYGEQRVGVGFLLSDINTPVTVLVQQISLPPLRLQLKTWELDTSFGLCHTSAWAADAEHEGIGVAVSCRAFKLKPVTGVSLPSIRDLSEVRVGLSVSVDLDEAVHGAFARRSTVVAATLGWSF